MTGKNRRIWLAAAAIAIVLLGGCGSGNIQPESNSVQTVSDGRESPRRQQLNAFLDMVNREKEAVYDGERLPFAQEWADPSFDWPNTFTEEEIDSLCVPPENMPQRLSRETAEEDVRLLFCLLEQGYGGYDYFGGAEVFDRLEQKALETLPDDWVTSDQLIQAVSCIREAVTDNNLKIGGVPMVANQKETWFSEVYFEDPEQVEGIDSEWIQPSIAPDGHLCYTLAAQVTQQEAEQLPDQAVIDGKDVTLSWQTMQTAQTDDTVIGITQIAGGATLMTSRSMTADTDQRAVQLDAFSRVGTDYRDTSLLIWDLRSNSGGSDSYFRSWFAGFTGMNPDMKVSYAAKLTPLNKYLLNFVLSTGWYVDSSDGLLSHRDGIVFVLQDGETADTGESMVCQLRTVDNTLTVGSCSKGALLTGNSVQVWLPGSGLLVQWGIKLQQIEQLGNSDGTGLAPDLWVLPEKALERVEKLIEYYGLSSEH